MKKNNSLKGRNSFREVLVKGVKFQDRYVRLYVYDTNHKLYNKNKINSEYTDNVKLGISLNRHFGKAHERNKMRRRIKAIFSKRERTIKIGCSIVVKPDKAFKDLMFSEEEEIIIRLLHKAGLLTR